MDVSTLPDWLGHDRRLQLGSWSVGLPLETTMQGLSSIIKVRVLRWLCVPTPAMDVVTDTRRSPERVRSSWVVHRSQAAHEAHGCLPLEPGPGTLNTTPACLCGVLQRAGLCNVCDVDFVMWTLWSGLCIMDYVMWTLYYGLCDVHFVLWTMWCGRYNDCDVNYVDFVIFYVYCDVLYAETWWYLIICDYFKYGC
jgi:hypothetical protein